MHRYIEIDSVARIEYVELETVADMYLIEIYLINLYKPTFNVDDKAQDDLTLSIDESSFVWRTWERPALMSGWKSEISRRAKYLEAGK